MKRLRLAVPIFLLLVGVFVGFLLSRSGDVEPAPAPMPMVLRQVQGLGELHTVKYTYQNVFEHQTSRKPEQWTKYVPGLSSAITASTRNEALVGVTAYVEAGIDLSKARVDGNRLVLPRATLYRPHVDAKLHRHKRGVFWSDSNIALKALSSTEDRVQVAALEQGILAEAEERARQKLLGLVPEVGRYEIQFEG